MKYSLYVGILFLHSWLRWLVLGCGLATVLLPRAEKRRMFDLGFLYSLDVQLVLGAVLYFFLSPYGVSSFRHLDMKDDVQRFWAVEHVTGMVAAALIAHIARWSASRMTDERAADRRRFWATLVPWFLIVFTIPWPFLKYGRPLFRL